MSRLAFSTLVAAVDGDRQREPRSLQKENPIWGSERPRAGPQRAKKVLVSLKKNVITTGAMSAAQLTENVFFLT